MLTKQEVYARQRQERVSHHLDYLLSHLVSCHFISDSTALHSTALHSQEISKRMEALKRRAEQAWLFGLLRSTSLAGRLLNFLQSKYNEAMGHADEIVSYGSGLGGQEKFTKEGGGYLSESDGQKIVPVCSYAAIRSAAEVLKIKLSAEDEGEFECAVPDEEG